MNNKHLYLIDLFLAMLQEIEEEHWYWFNSRHGVNQTQEHDLIINHLALRYTDTDIFVFKIKDNSELPPNIQEQCHLAYNWIFGK